jgi:hypothetical protein
MIYSMTRVLPHSKYTVLVKADSKEEAIEVARTEYGYSSIFEDIHLA